MAGTQANASTVNVQSGDTVWGFSQAYHVSIKSIVKANSLSDANLIYVNQKLSIPDNQKTTTKANTTTARSAASSAKSTTSSSSNTSSSSASTSSTKGGGVAEALKIANSDVPYVYGGNSMSGFDCSGLVQYVFGLSARTTIQQAKLGTHHTDVANAPYGAILFWGSDSTPYHDGISLGNGKYVAAQNESDGIDTFTQNSYFKPSYYIVL